MDVLILGDFYVPTGIQRPRYVFDARVYLSLNVRSRNPKLSSADFFMKSSLPAKNGHLAKSRALGIDAPDQLRGSPARRGSGRGAIAGRPPRFRDRRTRPTSGGNGEARRRSPPRVRGERAARLRGHHRCVGYQPEAENPFDTSPRSKVAESVYTSTDTPTRTPSSPTTRTASSMNDPA